MSTIVFIIKLVFVIIVAIVCWSAGINLMYVETFTSADYLLVLAVLSIAVGTIDKILSS
jgi:hypothetical protein